MNASTMGPITGQFLTYATQDDSRRVVKMTNQDPAPTHEEMRHIVTLTYVTGRTELAETMNIGLKAGMSLDEALASQSRSDHALRHAIGMSELWSEGDSGSNSPVSN